MAITLTQAPGRTAATTAPAAPALNTSVIERDEAIIIVAAMVGLADHIETHADTEPDAEFRSMRTAQIGAQLQAGFLLVEDTIGMPLTNFSPVDHRLIERALNFALKEEVDETAISILQSVAYLMAEGLTIVTE